MAALAKLLRKKGQEAPKSLFYLRIRWPNLNNLSGGLNLSRGLNIVGYTFNCIKCLQI